MVYELDFKEESLKLERVREEEKNGFEKQIKTLTEDLNLEKQRLEDAKSEVSIERRKFEDEIREIKKRHVSELERELKELKEKLKVSMLYDICIYSKLNVGWR